MDEVVDGVADQIIERLAGRGVEGPPRDFHGYGEDTPAVVWPERRPLALNFVINYEEGSEASWVAGDGRNEGMIESRTSPSMVPLPAYRDLHGESAFEYGSRAGIWRLFRLFADYDIRVTMFAAAVALEQNPAVGEAIARLGHEPCSHGWRWGGKQHWELSIEEERERIALTIEAFERLCGARPVGWYCRYGPSINTRPLLVEEGGFTYDSDAYNDDLPYFVDVSGTRHLVIPYTLTHNDGKLVSADGFSSRAWAQECCDAIDEFIHEADRGRPKMMTIGLHSRIVGHPNRTRALRRVIEYALERGVWIARRSDIADWWRGNAPRARSRA